MSHDKNDEGLIRLCKRLPSRSAATKGLMDSWPTGSMTLNTNTVVHSRDSFSGSPLLPRKMHESYIEVHFPFSTDVNLQEEYRNFYGGIRFGKIMEDMDSLAGTIAYRHCDAAAPLTSIDHLGNVIVNKTLQQVTEECNLFSIKNHDNQKLAKRKLTIVTASVDRIHLNGSFSLGKDYRLSGFVASVGRSSMEVLLRLEEKTLDETTQWDLRALATFTMVARNPETQKADSVPPLQIITVEEKRLSQAAEERKLKRRQFQEVSLFKSPPLSSEMEHLHALFLKCQEFQSSASSTLKRQDFEWMESNRMETTIICHPQERNIHNFIFGGFLLRQAFEVAFANASRYCHGRPYFLGLDETNFQLPVPIGSLLIFKSGVDFAENSQLTVGVAAELLDVVKGTCRLSNTFHFTFEKRFGLPVSRLLPKTYHEAMQYLEAKRRHDANHSISNNGTFFVWNRWIDKILSQ